MNKIFRLAKAELSKIFMRPSMIILTTILAVSLIFSYFFFSPSQSSTKKIYEYGDTQTINIEFKKEYEYFESEITDVYDLISTYTTSDSHTELLSKYRLFQNYFKGDKVTTGTLHATITSLASSTIFTDQKRNECILAFNSFKQYTNDVYDYMRQIKDSYINFFIKESDFDKVYKMLENILNLIPSESFLQNANATEIINRYNTIDNNSKIKDNFSLLNGLEKIEIDDEQLTKILDDYFYSNFILTQSSEYEHTGKLETLFNDIENFYLQNTNSQEEEVVNELNEKISKYYDYIQICKVLLRNNFELLRVGSKTDDELVGYVSFSNNSIYSLKTELTRYNYFYENETFGYEYLNSFNFNVNSGTSTNAYDFAFYAMQILSTLIIIFVIFFACSLISGEQSSGVLKMTITKPYTRNKIYSGKFLACFNVSLILLIVSLIASLSVGFAMYGFSADKVLLVLNAEQILITTAPLVMLIYFANLLINVVFYISLAILFSQIFKNTTISTTLTSAVLLMSTVIAGTVNASWTRFIPSLNLNLFKFFTTTKTGLLSFSVVPNITLWFSIAMIVGSVFIFDMISRLIFNNKNLDK